MRIFLSKRWTRIVGLELSNKLRDITVKIYTKAADYARQKGIIIADTKFEFGITPQGITLADEVLTPGLFPFLAGGQVPARPSAGILRQAIRSGLSGANSLEQAAARAGPPPGGGSQDQRKISGGVSPAHRTRAGCLAEQQAAGERR